MTSVQELRHHQAMVRPYPSTMIEVPSSPLGAIRGRSFFPGGCGLFEGEHQPLPAAPLLVIGNDFGVYDTDYVTAATIGEELMEGTWLGMLGVLSAANIDPRRCFFSNAVMGARVKGPNTGASPGVCDKAFASRCASFLRIQVKVLKPAGLIMLGKSQSPVLAGAFPQLSALTQCDTWRDVDNAGVQFHESIVVEGVTPFRFCAIMHPCLRASNMKQHGRHFRELRDHDAEVAMLKLVAGG